MPFYEYFCPDCQSTFELHRPMADRDNPAACSECGSLQTARVMSTFTAFGNGRALQPAGCGSCTPTASGCASCGIARS